MVSNGRLYDEQPSRRPSTSSETLKDRLDTVLKSARALNHRKSVSTVERCDSMLF